MRNLFNKQNAPGVRRAGSGLLLFLTMMASLAASAQPQEAGALLTDIVVHDPVMIRQDSTYYLFCTGRGIGRYRSTDLVYWERLPGVFQAAPDWVMDTLPDFKNHVWAPDIFFDGSRYVVYYSVSAFGKNSSCIGMVSSPSLHPEDSLSVWTDHGPVICSEPGKDDWNAIDPNLVLDESGQAWLSFGSFWSGLQLFPLDPGLTRPLPGSGIRTIASRPRTAPDSLLLPGDGAIEAPFIIHRHGWYYLFASYDYCCRGEKSTYHIRVGRARSLAGPFLDREGISLLDGGGTLLMQGGGRWSAVGHNAVVKIGETDYLLCHGYDSEDEGKPKLILLPLLWEEELWPQLR